jgi:hypothetical protein
VRDIQNLEGVVAVALKLEKNIITTKKVQPSPFRLFDPQGKASHEMKKGLMRTMGYHKAVLICCKISPTR